MINLKTLWFLYGPPLAKPILGFSLGGSSSKSKFQENTITDVNKKKTGTTKQSTTNTTTGESSSVSDDVSSQKTLGEETLSTLDDETKGILSDLLGKLGAGGGSAELVSALNERALSAEDRLPGLVDPIVANARSNLEEQLGQSIQGFARSAGSSQNTLVQQLGLQESANVEREIADLSATLGLGVDAAITEQQQGAVGQTEGLVAQLADILKGATQTGTSTQSTDVVRQLTELVSSLQTDKGEATGTTTEEEIVRALESVKGSGRTSDVSASFSLGI